jgi:predicted phosphodiesterase
MVNTIDELKQLIEDDDDNQYIAVRQPKVSTEQEHELVYDSQGFIELPDGTIVKVVKPPPQPVDDIQKFYDTTIKPQIIPIDTARVYADKNQDDARDITHAFNTNFDQQDRWSAAGRGIKVSAPFVNDETYEVKGFYYLAYKCSSRSYNIESFGNLFSTQEGQYLWYYKAYPTPIITNKWIATFNGNTNEGKNWNSFPALVPVGVKVDVHECPPGQHWDINLQKCVPDTEENRAPIANAGSDQIVSTGQKVILDGRGSSDPDGDLLNYIWTLQQGSPPAISEVFAIPNFEGAVIEFMAPAEVTEMVWELKVTDPKGLSATDTCNVSVTSNPPTKVNAVVTITTDTDCGSDTKQTLKTMAMHKPDLSLHCGDLSHVDSSAGCYYTISEQNAIFPVEKVTNGNHDGPEDGGSGIESEIRQKYNFPSQQDIDGVSYPTKGFYRVLKSDKKLYLLCLFTQDSQMTRRDSDQYKFCEAALKEAKRLRDIGTIKWIVTIFHKPIYTKGDRHTPERGIREIYQPLFDQYGVDVVSSGHVHVGEVTKPIKYGGAIDADPIVVDRKTSTGAWDFSKEDHGQIYITASSGGRGIDGVNNNNDEWSLYTNDQEFLIFVLVLTHDFNKLTIIAQPNNDITINKFSTVIEKGQITEQPLQSNAGDDQTATAVNQTITLDGRRTTGFPTTWKWEVVANEGNHPINLIDANAMRCSFLVPESFKTVKKDIVVSLTVTSPAGTSTDTATIFNKVEEVPVTMYPLPVTELYNSDNTFSKDITIPQDQTHPNDKVLLSSGASGVDSHSIKGGWLEIETGGGNGRVYWNHHEIGEESLKFNNYLALEFKLPSGSENLSIKDGNHGTDGWSLEGRFVFGGFGFSIHRTEIQSKLEWYHNVQGNEVSQNYPGGRSINSTDVYQLFAAHRTDAARKDVVLDVWIKFPNEAAWTQVMTNRRWGGSGDYDVPSNIPDGEDKSAIEEAANLIPRHHVWTRNNGTGSAKLPIRKIRIGKVSPIS